MVDCDGTWSLPRTLGESDDAVYLTCSGCGEMMVIDRYLSVGNFPRGTPEFVMIDAVIERRRNAAQAKRNKG